MRGQNRVEVTAGRDDAVRFIMNIMAEESRQVLLLSLLSLSPPKPPPLQLILVLKMVLDGTYLISHPICV